MEKKKNTAREPLAASIHHVSELHRTPRVALEVKTLAPKIRVRDGTPNALAF